jgi:hypothetical protein
VYSYKQLHAQPIFALYISLSCLEMSSTSTELSGQVPWQTARKPVSVRDSPHGDFWHVMLCSLVNVYRRFGSTCYLSYHCRISVFILRAEQRSYSPTLRIEVGHFSETYTNFYHIMRRRFTQESIFQK